MKRFFCSMVLLLCLCIGIPVDAAATETKRAVDISGPELITQIDGLGSGDWLFDGFQNGGIKVAGNSSLTLENSRGFGSLYLIFDVEYGPYTLTNNDTGEVISLGQEGFLHEFVPLEGNPRSVTITFDNGPVLLNELYVFTEGQVPDHIQQWKAPKEGETDLVLFSTHGDDEHLFFAGILPYYGSELGYQVQVVYLTNHRNLTNERCHEMLNGLWAVGMDTYPVFGPFPDYFCRNLADCYTIYSQMGVKEENMLSFVVEQVRRFKPKVAVSHDPINGEYRHGMHMMYADLLMKSLEIAGDPQQFPESAQRYGTWEIPKTYLHCYPENPIVMDWDQPLQSFSGMTAYEVSTQIGFSCHQSQYNDFAWYISGMETAAEIPNFGPRDFGLYRSLVGEDVQKNDFFENLTTYAQDAQEKAWQEDQRRAEEEAKRIEEERLRQEAQTQAEQSALQPVEAEKPADSGFLWWIGAAAVILAAVLLRPRKKQEK